MLKGSARRKDISTRHWTMPALGIAFVVSAAYAVVQALVNVCESAGVWVPLASLVALFAFTSVFVWLVALRARQ
ncbi:hypothetical protein [Kribbella ginsengisoli]|uniref:DUF4175 domain-containing protein n=1 Tax=Kribbella ginsengisoli TaxID=363865 RepID=A0ABP6VRN2_9ACTN